MTNFCKDPSYLRYVALKKGYFEEKRRKEEAEQARAAQKIRHSGLKRNLAEENRLRDMIHRFEKGGNLNSVDLRFLLQYYGIMIRMCEMSGESYYLSRQDAYLKHQKLLQIASERDWTQNLINMYGTMVESVFERIM